MEYEQTIVLVFLQRGIYFIPTFKCVVNNIYTMKFPKKLFLLILFLAIVLFVSGCAEQTGKTNITENKTETTEPAKETEPCTPSWTCTDWTECTEGTQTRTCTDANKCLADKPAETQACTYQEPEPAGPKIFENAPNGFDYYNYVPHNETIEASTKFTDVHLLYEFPIMGSPMPYYIYNTSEVNKGYFDSNVRQIRSSLGTWRKAADYRVVFEEADSVPEYGILIEVVNQAPGDNAEADIVQLDEYTLITGGKMKIQAGPSSQKKTYEIMHGMGHIFGFAHSSKQLSVMYHEYAIISGGKQIITSGMNDALEKLYRDIPRSD